MKAGARMKPGHKSSSLRIFASDPDKAFCEKRFLVVTLLALVAFLGIFVPTGLYNLCERRAYAVISFLLAAPCVICAFIWPGPDELKKPWTQRFIWKANIWNAIFGFVGNYFWTHYFYHLLGARYTFDTYRFNDVPIPTYLATHCYFCFYHTAATIVLRVCDQMLKRGGEQTRWISRRFRHGILVVLILSMAYLTALLETATIASFPYYVFEDRSMMYKVGSAFYALYFVVSFPMYWRIDEDPSQTSWDVGRAALDSLAAAMAVTILLDLWRILIGPLQDLAAPSGLPFLPSIQHNLTTSTCTTP